MDNLHLDDFLDEEVYFDENLHDDRYADTYGIEIEPPYLFNPELQEINDAIDRVKQEMPDDPYYLNENKHERHEPIIELKQIQPPDSIEIWLF